MTLHEQYQEIDKLTQQLKAYIDEVRAKGNTDPTTVQTIRDRSEELKSKREAYNNALEIQEAEMKASEPLRAPAPHGRVDLGGGVHQKGSQILTVGEMFTKSAAFAEMVEKNGFERGDFRASDLQGVFKSTLHTSDAASAGFPALSERTGDVVRYATRMPFVHELVSLVPTSAGSVDWHLQTTFTNNAAETAEGSTKPDGVIKYELQNSVVRTIAVWIPVTTQQLQDVPQVQALINEDLSLMLDQRLESQILTGDGSAPNLRGILNTSGVQTQAKGSDTVLDALFNGIIKVQHTGYAQPDASVLHPNDYLAVRTLKDSNGNYIMGDPSIVGPMTVFGLGMAISNAETENTGLVGAFRTYARRYRRMGVDIAVGMINDDFVKNQRVILAEIREAFVVRRPAAFCKVTGI